MFHANAWGLPFAAAMTGAQLVLPGPKLDAASVLDLLEVERVTMTAGVPTVWMAVLAAIDAEPKRWDLSCAAADDRRRLGGAGEHDRGLRPPRLTILQAWGMTETSPLGTVCHLPRELAGAAGRRADRLSGPPGARRSRSSSCARATTTATRSPGTTARWASSRFAGPWVAVGATTAVQGADSFTADGWFTTGDIVAIDERGCIRICDRSKDLIKSGGEWISSVDLENALMAHPAVAEAAVIAVPDERWGERPLAVVVLRRGRRWRRRTRSASTSPRDFAKWQLPERFECVDGDPADRHRQVEEDRAARAVHRRRRRLRGEVRMGTGGKFTKAVAVSGAISMAAYLVAFALVSGDAPDSGSPGVQIAHYASGHRGELLAGVPAARLWARRADRLRRRRLSHHHAG